MPELHTMGAFGILLTKDFGSVLSMHRDEQARVLAALREVYDGSWEEWGSRRTSRLSRADLASSGRSASSTRWAAR